MQYIIGTAASNMFLPHLQRMGLYIAQQTLRNTFQSELSNSNTNFIQDWSGNILKDFLAKGLLGAGGYVVLDKILAQYKEKSVETKSKEDLTDDYSNIKKMLAMLVMFLFYFTGEKDVFDYVKRNLKENIKISKNELEIQESQKALGIVSDFQENELNVAGDWTLYESIVNKFYREEIESRGPNFSFLYYLHPLKFQKLNPMRLFFSIFLGLSISISNFFGVKYKMGSSSIQIYKLFLYFEVLAHLLKLHNMGPLYNLVMQLKGYILSKNIKDSAILKIKSPFALYPSNPWTTS